ncbi:lactose 3-dehydrogenase subunit gamma LacC [Postechiella marina]|uniref:Lactose 3-dehydrogenase subunit gamma LacC n=1 Tax=Postechiella marina TaxID=943941 RepID=A0ABP8C6B5_9FLAO
MNRRDLLKGIGLTVGYAVATPSILSLLHSCTNEAKTWTPIFLSPDQGIVLTHLVDLILPTTKESPGALDVNVPEFIDLYVSKSYTNKEQAKFKKGLSSILNALSIPEEGVSALKNEDYDALLAKYLKTTKTERKAYKKGSEDFIIFNTLKGIRSTSIWAYKTSEKIGKEVLAYDPIPGVAKGCISVDEATKGKAWSL